jgi:hypothetical protein
MLIALCEKPAPRDALRLAVAMSLEAGDRAAPADIRAHVDRLIELVSALASLDEPWPLVEALLDGDLAGAARLCPSAIDTLQFFARLASSRPDVLTCVASTVTTTTPVRPDAATATRFAGLAMLLPELECHSPELRAQIAVECAMGARDVLSDPIIDLFRGEGDETSDDDREPSALAEEVMARFASRLFGFAGSTPAYLYANFLEGSGAIRSKDDEIVIGLPPVPLEVILHLAGMHERRFTVPWIPDKTIVLRLGGLR